MNSLRNLWKKIIVIFTTPITLRLLYGWWRRKRPKAAEPIILVEPKDEPEFLIPLVDVKKFSPGPRFVIERRRRAMKAGKLPGPSA